MYAYNIYVCIQAHVCGCCYIYIDSCQMHTNIYHLLIACTHLSKLTYIYAYIYLYFLSCIYLIYIHHIVCRCCHIYIDSCKMHTNIYISYIYILRNTYINTRRVLLYIHRFVPNAHKCIHIIHIHS